MDRRGIEIDDPELDSWNRVMYCWMPLLIGICWIAERTGTL